MKEKDKYVKDFTETGLEIKKKVGIDDFKEIWNRTRDFFELYLELGLGNVDENDRREVEMSRNRVQANEDNPEIKEEINPYQSDDIEKYGYVYKSLLQSGLYNKDAIGKVEEDAKKHPIENIATVSTEKEEMPNITQPTSEIKSENMEDELSHNHDDNKVLTRVLEQPSSTRVSWGDAEVVSPGQLKM